MPKLPIIVDRIIGKKFGKLKVLEFSGFHYFPGGGRKPKVRCVCDCGNEVDVIGAHLENGNSSSCGCLHRELLTKRLTTHGHGGHGKQTPTYVSWYAMLSRCRNPNTISADRYAKRGITVCSRWQESFENFISDMGERPTGMTLHRKNNDGQYSPENCVWATRRTQNRLKSTTRFVTLNRQVMTLADVAERSVVSYRTLHQRLDVLGWNLSDAMNTPSQRP